MTKRLTKLLSLALVVVMLASTFAACTPPQPETPEPPYEGLLDMPNPYKQAQYNTTTSVMPSNWNEFTYQDNNDTQILGYLGSSFFEYDFKFENDEKFTDEGYINFDAMVEGAYTTNYSAATKLEDVTASVDAKWGYTAEQKAEGGYAWKITLRDTLKWHDGTPITAADFEYSMKEILNPDFMNYRANTYYDTLMIKNAKAYFNSKAPIYSPVVPPYGEGETPDYRFDIDANEVYMNTTTTDMTLAGYSLEELINDYVGSAAAKAALKVIADAKNEFGYTLITEENYADAMNLLAYALLPFGLDLGTMGEEDQKGLFMETLFYVSGHGQPVEWDAVGCYAIPEENAIVLCLDKAYAFLAKDGSLSYLSAYYMSSLPLVKQDLYESCKKAPAEGATLWTSNYNSSLDTTASWGPYMLSQFEGGSHYKLVKNPNWYGWKLGMYQNQYNVTSIYCRKVAEFNTQWMGFLAGEFDSSSLNKDNVAEYLNSKYVYYQASTGTFGMQLFSDLNKLKGSENNNGILAILEFRQAFNLAINRSDVVEKIWPGSTTPCFGLVNSEYYYDIENSPNLADGGRYRNNPTAKAGILRAYGYVQAADGTWSINDLEGMDLDEAYETLTGYNFELAQTKLREAIEILEADPEHYGYDSTKNITLIFGSSSDTPQQRDRATYIQELLDRLSAGTKLEDKIDVVFDASAGSKWSDAFRSGATQIGFGYGFSGNAFNPFDIIGAFVNPDDSLNYHAYWDTSEIELTLTLPAGDYAGAGQEHTMSVQNWYFCLNGLAESEEQEVTYNWDAGFAPTDVRLMILSALEELTIKESRSVMLISDAGGSMLGAKFSYPVVDSNVFMGFGGIRYIIVNYTDAEWTEYVESQNGDLSTEYKKSE